MNPLKFVPIAEALARMSKDPSTQVGALAIDDDGNILSTGYNGFPRGVVDSVERYADRPTKLSLIAHAELNVIAQAARNGVRLHGATLLVTALYPCTECAKAIIQAGFRQVLAPREHHADKHREWEAARAISQTMFHEAGVTVGLYDHP